MRRCAKRARLVAEEAVECRFIDPGAGKVSMLGFSDFDRAPERVPGRGHTGRLEGYVPLEGDADFTLELIRHAIDGDDAATLPRTDDT